MGYSKQVVEKVREDFENRRKEAEDAAKIREQEVYAAAPMLKDIDAALGMTGIKIYGAALEGKRGLEERIAALRKENESLIDDKKRILAALGKPEDYLDVHYSCSKCNDSGYAELKMCECMKKALVNEAYVSSGLGSVLTEQGFDNFDLKYYSDTVSSDGISPKENMKYILKEVKAYADAFCGDKDANLLFFGKTGLGKTHLSTAVAKSVIDKGFDVVYDSVQNIVHTYELQTFSGNAEAAESTERYQNCALLIIDDLGTEFKSGFTQSVLYGLLNHRINAGKAMIINTNLDESSLFRKQYDDRITSRLIGSFRSFKFFGEDIRLKKTKQNKK